MSISDFRNVLLPETIARYAQIMESNNGVKAKESPLILKRSNDII